MNQPGALGKPAGTKLATLYCQSAFKRPGQTARHDNAPACGALVRYLQGKPKRGCHARRYLLQLQQQGHAVSRRFHLLWRQQGNPLGQGGLGGQHQLPGGSSAGAGQCLQSGTVDTLGRQ